MSVQIFLKIFLYVLIHFKALLSEEKLPSLEGVLVGGKSMNYSEYFLFNTVVLVDLSWNLKVFPILGHFFFNDLS